MTTILLVLVFLACFVAGTLAVLWAFKRCYIGGTNFAELGVVDRKLKARKIGSTIDILGEHIKDLSEAEDCVQEYIKLIRWMDSKKNFDGPEPHGLRKSVSVKLTHLGLKLNYGVCVYNLFELVEFAREKNIFVWVDCEEKETLDDTLAAVLLVHRVPSFVGWIGMAIQSCHRYSAKRVEVCCLEKIPVRLCKGAYPDGDISDDNELREIYISQAKKFLDAASYVAMATHDSAIISEIEGYVCEKNIGLDKFEFQMLLGIRMGMQEHLAKEYRMVTYLPFGENYKAYLTRRIKKGIRNFGLAWMFVRNLKEGFLFSIKKK
jgi:proline dehydrogenase